MSVIDVGRRIAEIRARLDAATPGPWERHPSEPWVYVRRGPFTLNIIATQLRSGRPGDADLIAHAPADIAWLLDEINNMFGTIGLLKSDLERAAR